MESWAEGVETIVTNNRYFGMTSGYNSTNSSGRRWNSFRQEESISTMNEYTPIVEDLIDDLNQNVNNRNWPMDRVRNYSLQQIQRALDNCRTIDCWERNLKSYYHNSSEQHLNELFDYMRGVLNNNNPNKCD